MKTMQEEWRNYRDSAYPNGMPAIQNRETHQAFFAGALVVVTKLNEIAALPDAQAEAKLNAIQAEVLQVNQFRADTLKGRN